MSKKGYIYYQKILELKNRVAELKRLLQQGKLTKLEYRTQMLQVLEELNKLSEENDSKEFSTLMQDLLLKYN